MTEFLPIHVLPGCVFVSSPSEVILIHYKDNFIIFRRRLLVISLTTSNMNQSDINQTSFIQNHFLNELERRRKKLSTETYVLHGENYAPAVAVVKFKCSWHPLESLFCLDFPRSTPSRRFCVNVFQQFTLRLFT